MTDFTMSIKRELTADTEGSVLDAVGPSSASLSDKKSAAEHTQGTEKEELHQEILDLSQRQLTTVQSGDGLHQCSVVTKQEGSDEMDLSSHRHCLVTVDNRVDNIPSDISQSCLVIAGDIDSLVAGTISCVATTVDCLALNTLCTSPVTVNSLAVESSPSSVPPPPPPSTPAEAEEKNVTTDESHTSDGDRGGGGMEYVEVEAETEEGEYVVDGEGGGDDGENNEQRSTDEQKDTSIPRGKEIHQYLEVKEYINT